LAKVLDTPDDNLGWEDLIPKKNNNENPKSDNNNESAITIESNNKPNPEIKPGLTPNTINKSKSSNNPKPNPKDNPINNSTSDSKYEKVKYTDTKTQRAFYYDDELIEVFDREYPKNKYDKSQMMNDMLRRFLMEKGKIKG
jgi:hypothetical protein